MVELNLSADDRLITKDIERGIACGNLSEAIRDADHKGCNIDWKKVNAQLIADEILLPFDITGVENGALKGGTTGSGTTYTLDSLAHVTKQSNMPVEHYLLQNDGRLAGLKPDAQLLENGHPDDGQHVIWRDNHKRVHEIARANHVNDEIAYGQDGHVTTIKRTYEGSVQSTLELDRNSPPGKPEYLLRNKEGIALGTKFCDVSVTDTGLIKAKTVNSGQTVEWAVDGSFRKREADGTLVFMQDANGIQYTYEWAKKQDPTSPLGWPDRTCPTKVTIQAPHMADIVMTRDYNRTFSEPGEMKNATAHGWNQYSVTVGGVSPQVDSIPVLIPAGQVSFVDLSIPIYQKIESLNVDGNGNLNYAFSKGTFFPQYYSYSLYTDGAQDRYAEGKHHHAKPLNALLAPGIPTI